MGVLIIWLGSLIVSIVILHWIITSAIESSNLARDIKEIKEILKSQQFQNASIINQDKLASGSDTDVTLREECPACGEQVRSTDKTCRSCGLTLIIEEQ